jgi:hypothetical protein
MCDYSLMTFPNRLANEGEILVTHKFSTGSIGFVSPQELFNIQRPAPCVPSDFWSRVRGWFVEPSARSAVPAVCIPPGARLKVQSIPERVFGKPDIAPEDLVTFTQVSATWGQFRDGLRTAKKQEILLQTIGEGLEIQVLSLTLADESQPQREEYSFSPVSRR